eukprot:520672-Amorphochlora_amoeboformis.AAC.1
MSGDGGTHGIPGIHREPGRFIWRDRKRSVDISPVSESRWTPPWLSGSTPSRPSRQNARQLKSWEMAFSSTASSPLLKRNISPGTESLKVDIRLIALEFDVLNFYSDCKNEAQKQRNLERLSACLELFFEVPHCPGIFGTALMYCSQDIMGESQILEMDFHEIASGNKGEIMKLAEVQGNVTNRWNHIITSCNISVCDPGNRPIREERPGGQEHHEHGRGESTKCRRYFKTH